MPELENGFTLHSTSEIDAEAAEVEAQAAAIEAIEITPEIEAKYEGRFEHMSPANQRLRIQTLEHMEQQRVARDEAARAERESKDRESLEHHMGGLATSLTEIFVDSEDLRNTDKIREEVLQALKPLHERISRLEWDGVIR